MLLLIIISLAVTRALTLAPTWILAWILGLNCQLQPHLCLPITMNLVWHSQPQNCVMKAIISQAQKKTNQQENASRQSHPEKGGDEAQEKRTKLPVTVNLNVLECVRGTPAKTSEHLQRHVKTCEVHETTSKPSKPLQSLQSHFEPLHTYSGPPHASWVNSSWPDMAPWAIYSMSNMCRVVYSVES